MTRADLRKLLEDPRIRAFLRAIRLGEGTSDDQGYSRLVGGGEFAGFNDHPNKLVDLGNGLKSTAAGAYQFLYKTWYGLSSLYHFEDFSPQCQDEGAVGLLVEKAAHRLILDNKIEQAVKACAVIWASLPGSPYGQPTVTIEQFMAEYQKWLGKEDPVSVADAATAAVTIANPVVGAALSVFRSLWPELKPLFAGSGSEVAQRNVKAAEAVVNAVMGATGAATPAAAIDAVQSNPDAAKTARVAAVDVMDQFQLMEVGGGIAEARKFTSDPNLPPFWKTGAFFLTCAIMPLVYYVTWEVVRQGSPFGADIRASVVTAIVTGALGSALGFWLGTSFKNSARSTGGV